MGGKSQVMDPPKIHLCLAGGSNGPSVMTLDGNRVRSRPLLTLNVAQEPLDDIFERMALKTRNYFKGHVSSHDTKLHVWHLRWSIKHGTLKGVRRFCSLTRKSLTWMVVQGRQAAAGYVEMLQCASLLVEGRRLCGKEWIL